MINFSLLIKIVTAVLILAGMVTPTEAHDWAHYQLAAKKVEPKMAKTIKVTNPKGTLEIEVLDEKDQPTPCFVAFESKANGKFYERIGHKSTIKEIHNLKWLSSFRSLRHPWNNRHASHMDGQRTVKLPAGTWIVHTGKGLEYIHAKQEVEIKSNEQSRVQLKLERFVDLPAKGWWSGDTHVHAAREKPSADKNILLAAQAEDIHVSSILEMGDSTTVFFPQYGYGKEGLAQDGNYWLITGQEEPRTFLMGHTSMLNIPKFMRNAENYYLYDRIFKEAKNLGCVTGINHLFTTNRQPFGKFRSALSAMLLFPQQLVDFVEVCDNDNALKHEFYFNLLNLGFRTSITAGSDYPWGAHIGDQRVYVYVDPKKKFTTDRWFAALRAGRSYATQGPLVEFTVNGQMIGSELRVKKGDTLTIKARAYSHADITPPHSVAIYSMGKMLRKVGNKDPNVTELECSMEIKAKESIWLVAWVKSHARNSKALTSPIYVVVDDQPIMARGAELEGLLITAVEHLEQLKALAKDVDSESAKSQEFNKLVDEAIKFYQASPYKVPVLSTS